MNQILEFLNSHASCRSFTNQAISFDDELTIVTTAQRSPTSSNLQAYSIIGVREQTTKDKLSALSGDQKHINSSSLFLVFCADLYRLSLLNRKRNYRFNGELAESFIIATVDCALAASRALMAAQALGMGGVMVGGIRNNPNDISQMLELPELVYPVMGMSLGYPASKPKQKPRFTPGTVYFREKYLTERLEIEMELYDAVIDQVGYLSGREVERELYPDFEGLYSWSEHTARRMASSRETTQRPHMLSFLQSRGFIKR
jgi:nitroreductase